MNSAYVSRLRSAVSRRAVDVDRVADLVEHVEADADRQQDLDGRRAHRESERAQHVLGRVGEEVEVLEEREDPEVERDLADQPAAPFAIRGARFDLLPGDEVDDRREPEQTEEAPVPPAVEEVRRDEQQHVLRARSFSCQYATITTTRKMRNWNELKITSNPPRPKRLAAFQPCAASSRPSFADQSRAGCRLQVHEVGEVLVGHRVVRVHHGRAERLGALRDPRLPLVVLLRHPRGATRGSATTPASRRRPSRCPAGATNARSARTRSCTRA